MSAPTGFRFVLLTFCCSALFAASSFGQEDELAPNISPSPPAAASATATPQSSSAAPSPSAAASPAQLSDVLFKNLKARAIGPALMGGRVSDIAIDPRNPAVFYVGLATGGLFKTGNGGVTFDAMFDKQPVLSIGAVAVAASDADVVWVGTGEANDRNSSEWGNGVYRSTDGGANWENVGLKESRAIARIVVHPAKPDGKSLERWRRARSLQNNRRGQNLEARPERARA